MKYEIKVKSNPDLEKSFAFAFRIVKLYQHLSDRKKEFVLSKQILRSGTSIGANFEEAHGAQSDSDFNSKISIAYKEASSTVWYILIEAFTTLATEPCILSQRASASVNF